MKYKFVGQPATETQVSVFERELGIALPGDYQAFLQRVNGGRPSRRRFAPRWSGQPYATRYSLSTASELFGLRDDDGFDLRDELKSYCERIPARTLPIGRDPGGNLILLALGDDQTPGVHFWAMEEEVDFEGGARPDWSNVAPIAPSFSSFLDALEQDD